MIEVQSEARKINLSGFESEACGLAGLVSLHNKQEGAEIDAEIYNFVSRLQSVVGDYDPQRFDGAQIANLSRLIQAMTGIDSDEKSFLAYLGAIESFYTPVQTRKRVSGLLGRAQKGRSEARA